MAETTTTPSSTMLSRFITIGKDAVSLLRDGALFMLAVLLVAFPAQFNSILVDAGFEEGSVVGFKWKSKLVESNQALEDAQATIASLQAKNDELLKALNDANVKANDPELRGRATRLEAENSRLKEQTQKVQSNVTDTLESNAPLVEKVLSSREQRPAETRGKSAYTVGLQTVGVDDGARVAINEKLQADGFGLDPLTYSYPAGQRPNWFAPQSTVFYYAASARPMAEQVAKFMKGATGTDFAVQRGAGLGVDPARKDATIFVHYLRR
jgi:hypothetical protein